MHFLTHTAISIALASTAVFATSCKTYTPSDKEYTQPSDRTFVVSKGIVCESTTGYCKVPFGGYVTDGRTLNVTISSPGPIYDTISSVVGFKFNDTTTEWVGGAHDLQGIQNGTAAYVGLTLNHHCTTGTLSDCDDSAINNIAVEACTPYSINGGGGFSGTFAPVVSDASTVDALKCNPANTTQAKNGNNSATCEDASSQLPVGDASRLGGVSMLLLVGSLMVATLGFEWL
ncbi:hypothetical protein KCU81_g9458, partial [Aureobasidium melanogenum]|uniref:Uncharacterized protein n=1 Tax=Aureobasidium melanogenum (strain CBS 110374) TaxID=1043003 RepID=A0A074VRY3_AURM1